MNIKKLIEYALSVPKSLYVSYRLVGGKYFYKLPIMVRFNTKLLSLRGHVKLIGGGKFGGLKFGFGEVGIFDKAYERTVLQIEGTIRLEGKAYIGHGSRVVVGSEGILTLGDHFISTAAMNLICWKDITFGHDVTISWNTLIMDTDFHEIVNMETGIAYEKTKPIIIGNNVWLCTRSVILKGSVIPNGCIVGAGALVSKQFNNENTIIAGNPAKEGKGCITYRL